MKNFIKNIIPLLTTFFSGCYKFFQNEVLPAIHFIEAIKELISYIKITTKDKKDTVKFTDGDDPILDLVEWLIKKLGWNPDQLQKYIDAFLKSIKKILPDVITGKTFEDCLVQYIKYLKSCSKLEMSWILFKTASLMITELYPGKDLKEHQADFLAQTGYTYIKNQNN